MPRPLRHAFPVVPRTLVRRAGAILRAVAWSAAIAVGAVTCGPPPDDATVKVRMYDNAFSPLELRVPVGTAVTFANVGRNPHNAVAADGRGWTTATAFGAEAMPAGAEAAVRFDTAGVYRYYCTYHGTPDGKGMAGRLVVGEVAGEAAAAVSRVAAVARASGAVRRVPAKYPTIQAAVDAAAPGDLVLVSPGVYREEVTVTTPSLVIRGLDRNATIVDGEFVRGNGIAVLADGVAIENLTARHAVLNGFFWSGVTGWRGSWLTAVNNGDYGIYAFDATDGIFEHSYASGSPDAGFYVGQCKPCRAALVDVVAERNALGYSGTNASGVIIAGSTFRRNGAGIVPNTLDTELLPPQGEARIVANWVADNGDPDAPTLPLGASAFGNGILLAGSVANLIERNVVVRHPMHGVLVAPMLDRHYWPAARNVVRDNVVAGSGRADVAVAGPWSSDNCVARNGDGTVAPALLTHLGRCEGRLFATGLDLVPAVAMLWRGERATRGDIPSGDWKTQPVPPPQPGMPDAATAPARPAVGVWAWAEAKAAAAPIPVGGRADAAALPVGEWTLARVVFGAGAMWWTLAMPLWGIGLAVQGIRTRRVARGLARCALAIAATALLVLAGGWWYGGR